MNVEQSIWNFHLIEAVENRRAAALISAPPAKSIAAAVILRFEHALRANQVRIGMDGASANPDDLRVTLQFHIGEILSDQFFNAASGYRAQFRHDWQRGIEYNNNIVAGIREIFYHNMPTTFTVRHLTSNFDDCGPIEITREQACASLDPNLSKIWICARLIIGDGQVQQLPSGLTGPRLSLADGTTWPAISRDESDAWLDVKGAFLGKDGPYQLKDPSKRAKKLAESGEA